MISIQKKLDNNDNLKYTYPVAIFAAGLFVYMLRISYSGLWLDEAVEYFYSKFMSGSIIGINDRWENMYERIISTYQPPLYNVMMYFWLRLFDSEVSFRLAGILITLVGMLGIYSALMNISGYKWASAGALLYIFIPKIAYYALECAEYNLMLCCEAWALSFFVSCLKEKSNKSFAGFFIFSCLSVYSQYGAVFFVAGLYTVLLLHFLKDKAAVKKIAVATVITCVVAAIPLTYFFIIPQMLHQGSIHVSHAPVFAGGNVLYDFIRSIILQAKWTLSVKASYRSPWVWDNIVAQIMILIPTLAAFFAVCATSFSRKRIFTFSVSACLVSYLIYYISVALSFYAYTSYAVGFGNRYGLFLIPLWLFTFVHAASVFCRTKMRKTICAAMILCFVLGGFYYIYSGWVKSDSREAVEVWHQKKAFQEKTLIYFKSVYEIQFYIQHQSDYNAKWQDNIITEGWDETEGWNLRKTDYDSIHESLKNMGIFSHDSLFYIGPEIRFVNKDGNSIPIFRQVMSDQGYKIDVLYEKSRILLYLHK